LLNIDYVHRGQFESRILQINSEGRKFSTPAYFPSISSAATRLQLIPLIHLCTDNNYPRLLVSAYDLHHNYAQQKSIIPTLKNYSKQNFLFVDSGTFEGYWLHDNRWNYSKYAKMTKQLSGDFYTSFDEIPSPDSTDNEILSDVSNFAKKSSKLSKNSKCITVAHGNSPSQLISVVTKLAQKHKESLSVISIPERDCGKTLELKISTIKKIRKILSKENPVNLLHVLGCGNPLSIALFSYAGADSFDSVDWSRWTIDPKTLQFADLNHLPLIHCSCKICKRKKSDPVSRTLLHNLLFYKEFMDSLRMNISKNNGLEFLSEYFDRKILSKIVKFF